MVQVNLEAREDSSQSLQALKGMAHQVLGAIAYRLEQEGRLAEVYRQSLYLSCEDKIDELPAKIIERPPLISIKPISEGPLAASTDS